MQELACGYGLHPTEFWVLPISDLLAFINGKDRAEQAKWERARFIASAMADTSKVKFSWEKAQNNRKSAPLDEAKKAQLAQADKEILKRLGQL